MSDDEVRELISLFLCYWLAGATAQDVKDLYILTSFEHRILDKMYFRWDTTLAAIEVLPKKKSFWF